MATPYIRRRDRLVVTERIDYFGKVIAEIVAGKQPSIVVAPFHPARFARSRSA